MERKRHQWAIFAWRTHTSGMESGNALRCECTFLVAVMLTGYFTYGTLQTWFFQFILCCSVHTPNLTSDCLSIVRCGICGRTATGVATKLPFSLFSSKNASYSWLFLIQKCFISSYPGANINQQIIIISSPLVPQMGVSESVRHWFR